MGAGRNACLSSSQIKLKRMKTLFRNNTIELALIKGLLVGMGYEDGKIIIVIGMLTLEIKTWAFNRKPRPKSFNEL